MGFKSTSGRSGTKLIVTYDQTDVGSSIGGVEGGDEFAGRNKFYLFVNGEQSNTAISYNLDLRPYQDIISVSTLICTKGERGTNGGGRYFLPGQQQPFSNGGAGGDGSEIYSDIRTYNGSGYPTSISLSTDLTTVQGYATATRISDAAAAGGAGGVGNPDSRTGAQDGGSTTTITSNLEPYSFYVLFCKF